MNEKIRAGQIVKGKVTGIQPYGAFVALSETKQGLIHISEISHGYVKNVRDYVNVGDVVTVKVLSSDELTGRISLSLKAVTENTDSANGDGQDQNRLKKLLASSTRGFHPLKEKLAQWIEESKKNGGITQK